ncbi:MAG: hypothetical protein QOG47_194, partial [Mycobacterium sp.]|nr:hypothetical protein [Mycobacterium sp.]
TAATNPATVKPIAQGVVSSVTVKL